LPAEERRRDQRWTQRQDHRGSEGLVCAAPRRGRYQRRRLRFDPRGDGWALARVPARD